jgi:hypothetical protein
MAAQPSPPGLQLSWVDGEAVAWQPGRGVYGGNLHHEVARMARRPSLAYTTSTRVLPFTLPEGRVNVMCQRIDATTLASLGELAAARSAVQGVHLAEPVARYAVALLHATRAHPRVRVGASTRAGVSMVALARAFAVLSDRDFVAPHDVSRAAECSLPHRVAVTGHEHGAAAEVVAECLAAVPAPRR